MIKKNQAANFLNNKFFWIIFSILVSVILWGYVTTVEEQEGTMTYYGVDVTFYGEDALRESRGYIITDVSPTSVNVTLRGSRTVPASLGADDLQAVIDVSTVNRVGSAEKQVTINYPSNVDQSSLSVVSRTPNTISYYVDREVSKTVMIEGVFDGTIAEGYIREDFIFDPESIVITGPAAELELVDHALVTVGDRTDLDRTISYDSTFTLVDADGNPVESNTIEYDVEMVNVTMPVMATKQVPITVDLIAGGGAAERNATITCDPETITIVGDAATLEGINSISVATVDLSTFNPVITRTYPLIIPNDVENMTGITEVEVTVEISGLSTKQATISNLNYIGLPEGFTADIISRSLSGVVLRGPADSVAAVASNNLRAVADLSEVTTTGTIAVPVEIYVDGFTDVGAVGEYSIYIDIQRG